MIIEKVCPLHLASKWHLCKKYFVILINLNFILILKYDYFGIKIR